jgi:hypothetical protein
MVRDSNPEVQEQRRRVVELRRAGATRQRRACRKGRAAHVRQVHLNTDVFSSALSSRPARRECRKISPAGAERGNPDETAHLTDGTGGQVVGFKLRVAA